jgi:uncharacterized protein
MIHRNLIDQVEKAAAIFPVVAILGPRQVGKTTLVKEYIKTLSKPSIYLDLEKPADYQQMDQPEIFFNLYKESCIVIDEIQNKPEIFGIMRSVIDQERVPLRFIILGSAAIALLQQSSQSLAGRIGYLELTPLNLAELKYPEELQKHHFLGGFPIAWLSEDEESGKLWLDNFIETYISRDLPLLGLKVFPATIRRLWEMLAWQNGGLVNYSEISKSIGLSNNTIHNYLDFMERAYLIRRLYPFSVNMKKRLVKAPKLYLSDTGILHRLLRLVNYSQLLGFPGLGASWEAYVINQIYSLKLSDHELYFYRTHHGAESDLVITKGIQPVACVEIKFSDAPAIPKGFLNCIEDLGTNKNFIISPLAEDRLARHDIRICSLKVFLKEYLPSLS